MKELRLSNKSFIKTAKRFEKVLHKYISGLYPNCKETQEIMKTGLEYNSSDLISKLIKTYKQSPFKNMSGFVHKIPVFEKDNDIMNYIKVWYIFDEENKTITFKYSEKYNSKWRRKIQFVLTYEIEEVERGIIINTI